MSSERGIPKRCKYCKHRNVHSITLQTCLMYDKNWRVSLGSSSEDTFAAKRLHLAYQIGKMHDRFYIYIYATIAISHIYLDAYGGDLPTEIPINAVRSSHALIGQKIPQGETAPHWVRLTKSHTYIYSQGPPDRVGSSTCGRIPECKEYKVYIELLLNFYY